MEQNHITKDANDYNEHRLEYTFLTPVATLVDEELLQQEDNYHYCYSDQNQSSPRSDEENYNSSESNESQTEPFGKKSDPFSPHCKIPLPGLYGSTHFFDSTTFIRRRNERERARVRNVNDGFERLRQHLPLTSNQRDKRLSKVETLRNAIDYIHDLQSLLSRHSKSSTNK